MIDLTERIDALQPELVELRRELHRNPELSYQEVETGKRLERILSALPSMSVRTGVGATGLVAVLGKDKAGPCIALRADMDALPIHEETGAEYQSERPGVMHACGHDGHMAALIGAARVLSSIEATLPGPVKFLFQPAEEGGAGALRMIEDGALEDPPVRMIFGLHGLPSLEHGTVGVPFGSAMGSSDDFHITIQGAGAHAASPHSTVDPIIAAAHVITALQTIVSRNTRPLDSLVVSVTRLHAGEAIDRGSSPNAIPPRAEIQGTLRALSSEVRRRGLERLKEIVTLTARAFSAEADIYFRHGYPVLENHPDASAFAARVATHELGRGAVSAPCEPFIAAEDFSYYTQRVPGAYWFLGLKPAGEEMPFLHSPLFDFPDTALPTAVRMHCRLVTEFFNEYP